MKFKFLLVEDSSFFSVLNAFVLGMCFRVSKLEDPNSKLVLASQTMLQNVTQMDARKSQLLSGYTITWKSTGLPPTPKEFSDCQFEVVSQCCSLSGGVLRVILKR